MKKQIHNWKKYSDEELLQCRIGQLGLKIQGTELELRVDTLYKELRSKGLNFYPKCYLGDEWFCPDEVPIISMPFFLASPRLKQLELKTMLEVEGGNKLECLRLLRHECGHAINYAYKLFKRKKWTKMFGEFSDPYEETYKPRPYSRKFVRHLEEWYAQYHPDEDFAETFAVWLDPNSNWRERYKEWAAIKKLEYVDELMQSIAGKKPKVSSGSKMAAANRSTMTLENYYKKKRRQYAHDLPYFYDRDLRTFFSEEGSKTAKAFLHKHRKIILHSISHWTGEPKFMINRLLKNLAERCHQLELRVSKDEQEVCFELTAYLAVLTMNYRATGRFIRVP